VAIFNPSLVKTSDIVEVQESLRSILRSRFPDLDTSSGSVTDSILIQGTAYLAALFMAEAEDVRSRLSVRGLAERTDTTGVRALEDLASNWLVDLRASSSARGIITIQLSAPATFTIPPNIVFSRGAEGITAGLENSEATITIRPDNLTETILQDGSTAYIYNLLAVSTGVTQDQALSPGSFTTTYQIPNLISIFNSAAFVPPVTSITDDSITRIKSSVTKRGFSTYFSSKSTVLEANIPSVKGCVPIGAGDPEMARDTNRVLSATPIHMLGMSNIVVSETYNPLSVTNLQFSTSLLAYNGVQAIINSSTPMPIVTFFQNELGGYTKVSRVSSPSSIGTVSVTQVDNSVLSAGEVTLQVSKTVSDYWDKVYSNGLLRTARLQVTKLIGTAVPSSVIISQTPGVYLTQQLIDMDSNRPLGVSVQAQSTNLVSVKPSKITIIKAVNAQTSDIDTSLIKTVVFSLINKWDSESSPLSLQSITSSIAALLPGLVTSVAFSDGITFILHLPDGSDLPYKTTLAIDIESTGSQLIASKLTLSQLYEFQVSNRTCTLNVLADDIVVEIV
jgi:hypothetical protein